MDLDGDGDSDLLSGSWPGELFLFRRGDDGFAPPIMLQDENEEFINIGGGVETRAGEILITGNAEFVTVDGKTYADYHGKRYESTPERGIAITGTASAVHACDWDGDGDQDLLVGDIGGNVYRIPNLGSARQWQFGRAQRVTAGRAAIRVEGDAGPFMADWDGDGDDDLLVGDGHGTVTLFDNVGARGEPKLAKGVVLVQGKGWREAASGQPECGLRVKVCATDWNGDGRLDLLLGDYATLKPDLPAPTPAEAKQHAAMRAELDGIYASYGELVDKLYGRSRVKNADDRKAFEAELEVLKTRMGELQDALPPEEESHGWIWLFSRKPRTSDEKQ